MTTITLVDETQTGPKRSELGGVGPFAKVTTGSGGQAHNRERTAVAATRQSLTWLTGMKELLFTLVAEPLAALHVAATAAVNTAAVASITGVAGKSVFIRKISAGYLAAGAGTVVVSDGTLTYTYYVNGQREILLPVPLKMTAGATVTITTSAVAAVSGYAEAEYEITDHETSLAVCFDAPSDATADAWLLETDSDSVDVNRILLKPGEPVRSFQFTSGITRVDVIRATGNQVVHLLVEAV